MFSTPLDEDREMEILLVHSRVLQHFMTDELVTDLSRRETILYIEEEDAHM